MQYQNNTQQYNGQVQLDAEGFPIGSVIKKAMTKVRDNLSGEGTNRGILIYHTQTGQERWVSVDSNSPVAKCSNGSSLYFHGKGHRPSLTMNNISMNQPQADYYNRIAEPPQQSVYEQINNGMYPQNQQNEFDYNPISNQQNGSSQTPQRITDDTSVNDTAIEKACLIMSNTHNLLSSMLPNVDDEEITKMTISIYISQTKNNIPF